MLPDVHISFFFLKNIFVYYWIPGPCHCTWHVICIPFSAKVCVHTPIFFVLFQHPYPSEEQKKQLAQDTGLTILQVNNW